MPNWACGSVTVTGSYDNIKDFLSHFIFDTKEPPKAPYFARSFAVYSYNETLKDLMGHLESSSSDAISFEFPVEFAWSAHTCIVSCYPEENPDKCITLENACKLHDVTVEIFTEECGFSFAEHLICTPDGFTLDECVDLIQYQCQNCGEVQYFSPYTDIMDYQCGECGSSGDDNWTQFVECEF